MSQTYPPPIAGTLATRRALRGASFGVMVMLLVQFSLGMWANLYGALPASDHGKGILAAVGDAVAKGPLALSLHALLGISLLVAGMAALVRAVRMRTTAWIAITLIGFAALLLAAINGARFVGGAGDGASFGMALSTAMAMLCYAVVLFALAPSTA